MNVTHAIRGSMALRQSNLPDRIADLLVESIARLELVAGQKLGEASLCETLGVSRVPLREALRILQAQGIVTSVPNRGSFVVAYEEGDITDMLEIRVGIERTAFHRIRRFERGLSEALIVLGAQLDRLKQFPRTGDHVGYAQADLAFHEKVVELSASPMLTAVWRSLARAVLFFMVRESRDAPDHGDEIREHERLLALLRRGTPEDIDRCVRAHIFKNWICTTAGLAQPHPTPFNARTDNP